ncbi:ABC transporter ATP-binding protein [candidate division KSB1 bacterium]
MDSERTNKESEAVPLRIENLSKAYLGEKKEEIIALSDVSLELKEGDIYGYLGKNGAGKTTTFKLIMGLIQPDSGTITIFGRPAADYHARISTGYVPEDPGFHGFLTGRDLLFIAAELAGVAKADRVYEVDRVIKETSLDKFSRKKVKTYSKGQRQRLAIAQALLNKPRLLLLDEPSAGLDPVGIHWMIELLKRLQSKGVTIIFSSHQLTEVEKVANRIGILKEGRFIREEETGEILKEMSLEDFFMKEIGY